MLFMAKSNHRRKDLVESFKSSLSQTQDGAIADESLKLVSQDADAVPRSFSQYFVIFGLMAAIFSIPFIVLMVLVYA